MLALKNIINYNSEENSICSNLKLLLKIHTLVMIATSLSNIFINIFIWKASYSLNLVIEYNAVSYIISPLIFIFGGWFGKRNGLRINLISGMFSYTIFYLAIFTFRNAIVNYVVLLGAIRGISSGFYYVSFNVLGYDLSDDKNRDYFLGILGLINSSAVMIAPFISGYIISAFAGSLGYQIIFATSFIMFVIGTYMSFYLPNKHHKSKYHLSSIFALTFKNSNWTRIMVSEAIRGARENSVFSVIINLIIFMFVQRESSIGNYSFWTYLVATITCYVCGLIINQKSRLKFLLIGCVLTIISSTIFLIDLNYYTLWIFGIITAFSLNLISIPHNSISYAVISSIPKKNERRIESIIVKEIFLDIGRLFTLAIFFYSGMKYNLVSWLILLIGVIQIIVWLLLRKVKIKSRRQIQAPTLDFENKITKANNLLLIDGDLHHMNNALK